MADRDALIETLGRSRLGHCPLPDPARLLPAGSVEDGYDAQARLADWFGAHGQGRVAGYKVGATTPAMQTLLGVSGPVYGHIMSENLLAAGATFACNPHCGPGVECEIAFRLGEDLPPAPEPYGRDAVASRIDAVMPSIEIVENRYGDFRDCSLALLTADDFFHKACVIGEPVTAWRDLALADSTGRLAVNGEQRASGVGSEVLGDPLNAVVWLAEQLAARNVGLMAGQIISTGSMIPVQWIDSLPAQIEIHIDGVGASEVELTGR